MYKIIQILRASRLILLIILLLITIISQLARADSVVLYRGSYGTKECKEFVSPDPNAVYDVCFPHHQRDGLSLRHNPARGEYYYDVVNKGGVPIQSIFGTLKTCETKELTHDGMSDGVPSDPQYHWMRAPKGIDAADWYPDRFNTCENNCIVVNQRVPFALEENRGKKSITEDDGTSRSSFLKTQTGTVCVVEKQDPDVIKPPPPADGGKPDSNQPDNGQSGSNTGSDNGNGQGGNNQGGSGSQSDGGNSQGNNSGNDGSGGGSGSGSGGSSGGGGSIYPGGGGTSGGQNGSGSADGSESGDSGQGSGNSDGQGGSGDSGGSGSDQSGGTGTIDGGGDGDGEGDGKGEGSISGGSCAAEQAPSCKGDPIQCYIAVEQWRTACATAGNKSEITKGNCVTNTPPECKGDATQCYIARQQWQQGCLAADEQARINELEKYGKGKVGEAKAFADGNGFDGIGEAIKGNDSIVNIPSQLDTSGFGWSRTCPALSFSIDAKLFGAFSIDFSFLCGLANLLGNLFVAVSLVLSARYILR